MSPAIPNKTVSPEFLSGGGEMGQRIRDYDWSKTPLGAVENWPQSLRTCVRIMLASRQPIWIGWGKELIKLYNDPYKAIVRGKHPWALGKPAAVVWNEIWRDIDPMLHKVMEEDEGTYVESQLLIMERNGYPEETYYTFSYTPIPGDNGGTAGMICANTDDTERIISERQLGTLTQLGKTLTDCQSGEEVIVRTIETLKQNPYDFPFALFRAVSGDKAKLALSTAMGESSALLSAEIDVDADNEIAGIIKQALTTRQLQVFENVQQKLGDLPKGAWTVAPEKLIVLPVAQPSVREPFGLLVVALNPYRLLDDKYSSFFVLVADQIANSFANVHSLAQERKRAEALAELDKAKTTFFSNISHEFRTPLTLLLAPMEDVMSDASLDTENKARMKVAYRNALRMQKLVNTLLEFSRLEAKRAEGKFQRVDIGNLTEDLASTFRSAIERAGMHLAIRCERVTAPVYVDPDMWERIILNLVSNAFKYSKQGEITVSVKQRDTNVEVSVSDTGIGIPANELHKIFNRFYRVDNPGGRSQEGTGIGLAMVKELVKLHHGTITVVSTPGEGSVFTVSIPTGKDHLSSEQVDPSTGIASFTHSAAFVEEALRWIPSTIEKQARAPLPDGRNRSKVLLADDNADMLDYVERLLSEQFDVITARDGEEAYRKTIESRPDLVLSDVMMPRLDGFGLLEKIRSHPEIKNTPLIFLSARAGEEAKVEGLHAGADDYLIKPFSARELMVRVRNLIRINQVRNETELQFYRLFLEAPAIINVFKGPDFRYEIFHPKNREYFGDADFTGMPLLEALPELKEQPVIEQLQQVYHHGTTIYQNEQRVFFQNPNRGPVEFYFNYIYQPWYDLKGNIQGVLNFAIDVTEQVIARKKIEESERQYRELTEHLETIVQERTLELRRSNDDLQQFAHVASHDLKEPVRKLKTFINRLDDEFGAAMPEAGKSYIKKMRTASARMHDMIDGVLKYSSINEGAQGIEQVDLNELIADIESDLEMVIQQKQAVIEKDNLPTIACARILVYQLFYNLINNALKFSSVHPRVYISCRVAGADSVATAEIAVRDNGIGFEPEFADEIFQAFSRLHSKDRYEGTGLGLALCKKIAERHHGSIRASGKENVGSEFIVTLPIHQKNTIL
jgi:signal transduction histidine kinase/ActR/RegA family two-component response regulator